MKSVFLHGFLGLPSDWHTVIKHTDQNIFRSLWTDMHEIKDNLSFSTWVDYFLATTEPGVKAYGYSLGGRLLLHAYIKKPSHFSSLHLFSTNYGLNDGDEKQLRLTNDLKWVDRFKNDPWDNLIDDWNSQSIFNSTSTHFVRPEVSFSRPLLAAALDTFSLGRQENLLNLLPETSVPLHFIMGEKDKKFMTLLDAIPLKKNISTHILSGAGHRIPWDYSTNYKENWW